MNRFVTIFAAAVLVLSLTAADASAQQWQILASFPGRPAGVFLAGGNDGNNQIRQALLDFDGDGVSDPSFIAVDPSDPSGSTLYIQSGSDQTKTYRVSIDLGPYNYRLIGFFNFDGTVNSDNPKEILIAQKAGRHFVNPMVFYNIDGDTGRHEVGIPDGSTVLIGGWDLNNDGYYELVVGNPGKNEVQIWGFK
jgi:hypothetical protein